MRECLVIASLALGGFMMTAASATPEPIVSLRFSFLWNGSELAAGRTPIYGSEARSSDMRSGSPGQGTEVYALSPLPLRFLTHLKTTSDQIELSPGLPVEAGELTIRIGMSTDTADVKRWLEKGVSSSAYRSKTPGDSDGEVRAWLPDLAGASQSLSIGLQKSTVRYLESGTQRDSESLGSGMLTTTSPVEFKIKLPALQTAVPGNEEFALRFPDFELRWERRKSYLALRWPKGGPAAAQPTAGKPPVARKQAPFWMFWR